MKTLLIRMLALPMLCGLSACDDHGKEVTRVWKVALGMEKQADGPYRWYAYPVDNFGVATFYDPPKGRAWTDADRICATWSCLAIDPSGLSAKQRLEVNGFVDVGAGGPVSLTQQQSKELGVNLSIPILAKVAELSGGVDYSKSVDVTVSIQRAYRRSVDRNKLTVAIEASDNQILKDGFTAGRLAFITADVVAEGVTLTLNLKSSIKPEAKVKLVNALSVLAQDTSLGVNYKSVNDSTLSLSMTHPVILAVLTRKQPAGGMLGESDSDGEVVDDALPRPGLEVKR